MAKAGKGLKTAYEGVDPAAPPVKLEEAVKQIKSRSAAKFDETVEIAMNLNLDPRKPDQNLRGTVMLPHGTGKSVRVAVFDRGDRAKEAEVAGADIVGAEDLAEKVQAGQIDFDRAIATPDMMAVVGRLGKILGPRGLMPNPRLGTVTQNVTEAVQAVKGGQVEFRAEKAGIVHSGVGKASFTDDALVDNVRAFVGAITRGKPSGVKGTYIKRVSLASTMGPAVKVDVAGLGAALHRPDRDCLLAGPGRRGQGGGRIRQPQQQADRDRRRPVRATARRGRHPRPGDAALARRAARQDHWAAQRPGDQAGDAAADPGRPAGARP